MLIGRYQPLPRPRRGALVVAVSAGLLFAFAPTARAGTTCQHAGTTTICETNGSTNIKTEPGTTAPPANQPMYRWLVWD